MAHLTLHTINITVYQYNSCFTILIKKIMPDKKMNNNKCCKWWWCFFCFKYFIIIKIPGLAEYDDMRISTIIDTVL